jgi:hypothetical protein
VKFLCPLHLLENTLEESPNCSPGPQPHVRQLFRASSNVSLAEERDLDDPADLTINNGLQTAVYTPMSGMPYLSSLTGDRNS